MKTSDEIRARVRTLLLAELDARVEEASKRIPHKCTHNHRQELDARKEIAGEPNEGYNRNDRRHLPMVRTIGLCMLGSDKAEEWSGTICDDPIDAQRCPYFTPSQSKESLLAQFQEQVEDAVWLQTHLPAVYELLWVLEQSNPNFHLPWWKRWWYALLRVRLEPVRPDTAQLEYLLQPPGHEEKQDDVQAP